MTANQISYPRQIEELLQMEAWLGHYAALSEGSNPLIPIELLRKSYLTQRPRTYVLHEHRER